MDSWKVENKETGEWYAGVDNHGFHWTRNRYHASYMNRTQALQISRWLKSEGFKTKIV